MYCISYLKRCFEEMFCLNCKDTDKDLESLQFFKYDDFQLSAPENTSLLSDLFTPDEATCPTFPKNTGHCLTACVCPQD